MKKCVRYSLEIVQSTDRLSGWKSDEWILASILPEISLQVEDLIIKQGQIKDANFQMYMAL